MSNLPPLTHLEPPAGDPRTGLMSPEIWARVEELLDLALALPVTERKPYLDKAAGSEPEIRRQVEDLLEAEAEALGFIEKPLFALPVYDDREFTDQSDPEVGSRIGVYQVLRRIGRGGMGAVYLARRDDDIFDQQVAIKVLRRGRDTKEIVRRFHHERQILAQLDHSNIAKLLDGGTTTDGRPYFVMQYVKGVRIDHYCDSQCLSTKDRVELFLKVCSAVSFAHQNLVIHRDLKPGNILVNDSGEPILLDFGIAKLLGSGPQDGLDPTILTSPGSQPMTPRYASPEQVEGQVVTTSSDVYSLGILLYELLTGHRAYEIPQSSLVELRRVICGVEPERPSTVVRKTAVDGIREESGTTLTPQSVSSTRDGDPKMLRRSLAGDLDSIVLKALRKETRHRYSSVAELSDDLSRHLRGLPVLARQGEVTYRGYRFLRRHRLSLVSGAAVIMALFGLAMGFLRQRAVEALTQRDLAVKERDEALAVAEFMVKRFELSVPQKAEGERITARALLDEGRRAIREQQEFLEDGLEVPARGALGRAYLGLNLFDDARPLLEESLHLSEEFVEGPTPAKVRLMLDLAAVWAGLGEQSKAEALSARALSILERGEVDSPRLLVALNNRGNQLESAGELDLAEDILRQSLTMRLRLFGEEHIDVALARHNLAKVLDKKGKLVEAERLYRLALDQRIRHFGRESREAVPGMNSLAVICLNTGRLKEGEAWARESLVIRERLGMTGASLEVSRHNLATLLRLQGNLEEAEALQRQAYHSVLLDNGEGHRTVGFVLVALATTLESAGRFEEAEETARQALAVFHNNFDADHWRIAEAENVLGGCLLGQGKIAEAEPLIRRSVPVLSRVRGDRARATREAQKRLEALENGQNIAISGP